MFWFRPFAWLLARLNKVAHSVKPISEKIDAERGRRDLVVFGPGCDGVCPLDSRLLMAPAFLSTLPTLYHIVYLQSS